MNDVTVRIYFATNRNPNLRKKTPTSFGSSFNHHGVAHLRYGYADVQRSNTMLQKLVVAEEALIPDEKAKKLDTGRSIFGSESVMKSVRQEMKMDCRDTMIFVHGFNVSFRESVSAAAQLALKIAAHSPGRELNMVLFSWPSDGSLTPFSAYASDRQEAVPSGAAFARAFLKMIHFLHQSDDESACDRNLHLLAHSMGNYVLRHAVQEIRRQLGSQLPRVFDQVLLFAADEDDDAFETDQKLALLPRLARRVSVYFNREDLPLQASDRTKGNPDRLGTDGPRLPHKVPAKVSLIDCTDVVRGAVEHSYYLDRPVITDVLQVLADIPSEDVPNRRFVPEKNRYRLVL